MDRMGKKSKLEVLIRLRKASKGILKSMSWNERAL